MTVLPPGPSFSDAEYQRRWQAVAAKLAEYELDAIAITGPQFVPYVSGTFDDHVWPTVVLIGPDAKPAYVCREYDLDWVEHSSRIRDIRSYFGDDDHTQVWADLLRERGLERARLGIDLATYGATPADIFALQAALPNLTIIDATRLMMWQTVVKSAEEIAVMRHAMEIGKIGFQALFSSLHEGAVEWKVQAHVFAAMRETGGGHNHPPIIFGERSALPHVDSGTNTLKPGDVVYTELGGEWLGYEAGCCRTALLGRNPDAEAVYALAVEAEEAAIAAIRPGVVTAEVDRAYRSVVSGSPLGIVSHSRVGYQVGIDWMRRGNMSVHPGGTDVLEPGMTIHMPAILYRPGKFSVAYSETVLVTEDGCEALSGNLSKELVLV